MRVAWLSTIVVAAITTGCADQPRALVGEGCELSSQCAVPLVCRFGACREECRESRDCRAGLLCLKDQAGFGVCQVEGEHECDLTSQCPDGLVCRFESCTTECLSDRDCVNGLICDVVDVDERACRDPTEDECRLNSDCANPLHICARDLRCRIECITDRDCRDGNVCDVAAPTPSCVPPSMITDAGMDASMDSTVDSALDAGMDSAADAVADALPDSTPDGTPDADAGTMILAPPPFVPGVVRNGGYFDGTDLLVWGTSTWGQVGVDDPAVQGPTAIAIPGGAISAYAVGGFHGCAQTDRIYCWGRNAHGQLGRPANTVANPTPMATTTTLSGVVGLAAGFAYSCAWTGTDVRCWGSNENGQLGGGPAGAGVFTEVPNVVSIGGAPARVYASDQHTCAVRTDGTLYCWGRNLGRELGDGTTTSRSTPVAVPVPAVIDVALGRSHTCALHADGSVRCWGENDTGQVGNGATTVSEDPTLVAVGEPVLQISSGYDHTCAIAASGAIRCWGVATSGRLGVTPTFPPWFTSPVLSSLPSGAVSVGGGAEHTCAHYGSGVAWCVGSNMGGQFGTGDTIDMAETPVMVTWTP